MAVGHQRDLSCLTATAARPRAKAKAKAKVLLVRWEYISLE